MALKPLKFKLQINELYFRLFKDATEIIQSQIRWKNNHDHEVLEAGHRGVFHTIPERI